MFVDDIDFPGMLHAYVVRSAHAHAKILQHRHQRGETFAGRRRCHYLLTILAQVRKFPLTIPHPNLKPLTEFPLARDKVRYVGEPVAVIVATSRQLAEDAAALVQVDYEPMGSLRGHRESAVAWRAAGSRR